MRRKKSVIIVSIGVSLACATAGVYAAGGATSGGPSGGQEVAAEASQVASSVPTDGRILPLTEAAAEVLKGDPLLGDLPWLFMPVEGPPPLEQVDPAPSLIFPAGVTHQEALDALYSSLSERGALPADTSLGDPLSKQTLVEVGSDGLRISLTAPFGVDSSGKIHGASVALPGDLSPTEVSARWADAHREGRALPEGGRVDVPEIPGGQG